MELLADLWLPILASAAAVWIVSAIVWMAMPHHKDDFSALPDENAFVSALQSLNIPPGNYGFPDFKNCGTPEAKQRMQTGPLGVLNVWTPGMSMGKNMVLTFLVYIVVSVLIGYLTGEVLPRGSSFGRVMQIAGTAGILAYAFAFIPNGIWFQTKPRALVMCIIDGVVYGLVTGAVFAALWPAAFAAASS